MSSLKSVQGDKSITWPRGSNTSFLILPVLNVTKRNIEEAISFICGNCYYNQKDDLKRYKPLADGISPAKQRLSQLIQLESLFDYHRFQSDPSRQTSLLKCEDIQNIVVATQNVVRAQCGNYSMSKLSVLYSIPGGQPQGLHVDDPRSDLEMLSQGEMISVIFALQNGTTVDIALNNAMDRQTFSFPPSSIIMFSGNFRHGGSAYSKHNIRLHMYFMPAAQVNTNKKDNRIPVGLTCPVTECSFNVGGCCHAFTKDGLYNHWRDHHKKVFSISVEKYRSRLEGVEVLQCHLCGKGFTTGYTGLRRHLLLIFSNK